MIKKLSLIFLSFLLAVSAFAAVPVDYMEYAANTTAQSTYVSNGALDSNYKLLMHMDYTPFIDEMGKTVTNNNVTLSTGTKQFGAGSAYCNGGNGYLSLADNADFKLGSGLYTIAFWFWRNGTQTADHGIISRWAGGALDFIVGFGTTNNIRLYTAGSLRFSGNTSLANATWTHVEIDKENATLTKLYVNGRLDAINTDTYTISDSTTTLWIGNQGGSAALAVNGYIDDLEFSKGVARHTGNFTAPAAPTIPDLGVYSENTVKNQGSYSLKSVAVASNSLNKVLTRTISPTLDLSDISQLNLDMYASRTGSNVKISLHDSGGTLSEFTPSVSSANGWETKTWDISGISDANKDAIDQMNVTITNADSDNTFYLDNFYGPIPEAGGGQSGRNVRIGGGIGG